MKPNETWRIIRIANDYSIADLAAKTGVTSSYISAIECGKKYASTNYLDKLSKCYKLSASVLLKLIELSEEEEWDFKKTLLEVLEVYHMKDPRAIIMKN